MEDFICSCGHSAGNHNTEDTNSLFLPLVEDCKLCACEVFTPASSKRRDISAKTEYQICFVSELCYFKCHVCGLFLMLDRPSTYEEAEEQRANLTRQHKH